MEASHTAVGQLFLLTNKSGKSQTAQVPLVTQALLLHQSQLLAVHRRFQRCRRDSVTAPKLNQLRVVRLEPVALMFRQ